MGHREDLLAGAKRCLLEKGYARTTARDIVAASGANLGSIGYHYGSTEALLNAAMLAAIEEWGDTVGRTLAGSAPAGDDTDDHLLRFWQRVIASFTADRTLWLASIEALLISDRSPELRAQIAAGQQQGRRGMVALLTGAAEDTIDDATTRTLGSVQLALMSGVLVQWMTDPAHSPSAEEVVTGLRALAAVLPPDHGHRS
jgi:AcrR family transcriptional regulator